MAYDIIKEIENISDKMNNCVLDLLEKTTTEYGEKVAFEDSNTAYGGDGWRRSCCIFF